MLPTTLLMDKVFGQSSLTVSGRSVWVLTLMMTTDAFLCWCLKRVLTQFKVEVRMSLRSYRTRFVFLSNSFCVPTELVLRSHGTRFAVTRNSFCVCAEPVLGWYWLFRMNDVKCCNTTQYKWNEAQRISGFNRNWTHVLCLSAAVLYQLSYEDL